MEAIIVAVITSISSVIAVWFSNMKANREITHKLETTQAVSNLQIEELTREVKRHNGFAERIPRMEEQILQIDKRVTNTEKIVERRHLE